MELKFLYLFIFIFIITILSIIIIQKFIQVIMDIYNNKKSCVNQKGVILMYCTQNIIDKWAKYSIDINKQYALKNGYDFKVIKTPYDSSVTHAWQKIPAMIQLLEDGYNFVFYIDADAIINDPSISLESFFDKYEGDLLVCSDEKNSNGLYAVNGGCVIAKNTKKCKKLLKQWWDLRHEKQYITFAFEQTALSDIVRNKIENIDSSIISVCPETEFNSIYGEILDYLENKKSDRFVLHFMSLDDNKREKIFKNYNFSFT